MTSVETTVAGIASITLTGATAYTGYRSYLGTQETYKHSKYIEKVNKIKNADYTHTTDIHSIARALHFLNPREEIRTIDPAAITAKERETGVSERVIFISNPDIELKLPKGVETYKDYIYTQKDNGENYYIKLGNIKEIDESILLPAMENRHIDLKTVVKPVALIGTTVASAISANSHFNSASAATYDTKTYIESMSDTQLEELCTNLEEKTIDEQVKETLERKNVKKLIK